MSPETVTASEILALPSAAAVRLFPKDGRTKERFKVLAKRFHPDVAGGNADVFTKIVRLRQAVESGDADGLSLEITDTAGKKFKLRYRRIHQFELGQMAVGLGLIAFIIERKHEALYMNGLRQIGSVNYVDDAMRKMTEHYIPKVEKIVETPDYFIILIDKTPDQFVLSDLLRHLGGRLEPKHAAWVISSLLALLSFFELNGIVHNGMSVDTVLVSPQFHTATPIGGWWYAARNGDEIKYLPPLSHRLAPANVLKAKRADAKLDLECLREIGRTCVGGMSGVVSLPLPFRNYLQLPAPSSAVEDYANWEKVLTASFGARRFLQLDIDPSAVYP